MTSRWRAAPVAVLLVLAGACGGGGDDPLRMNHVQVIGTHNSYHRRLPDAALERLKAFDADLAAGIDYEHAPLDAQLDDGIRQLELDVFADPDGGRYASRAANPLFGLPKETGIAELHEPGFKVLHIQEIDFESTCRTLVRCLRIIESWSADHPRHLPVMVLVEAKDSPIVDPLGLGFLTPLPVGAAELDALDDEIRSVFGRDHLVTPDDVRGERATLREAVTEDGWPSLDDTRGKVLFALDNDGAVRDAYVAGHPSLRGRVMFTFSGTEADESAVVSRPDPVRQGDEIGELVRQGFLVRTRADADTREARTADTRRRDAALASGAHWVSTDYPEPDARLGSDYAVRFPGDRRARCNPVTAPDDCDTAALE